MQNENLLVFFKKLFWLRSKENDVECVEICLEQKEDNGVLICYNFYLLNCSEIRVAKQLCKNEGYICIFLYVSSWISCFYKLWFMFLACRDATGFSSWIELETVFVFPVCVCVLLASSPNGKQWWICRQLHVVVVPNSSHQLSEFLSLVPEWAYLLPFWFEIVWLC